MKKLLVMVLMSVLGSATMALAVNPTILTNYPEGTVGVTTSAAVDGVAGPLAIGSTKFSVSTNVKLVAAGDAGGYNVASKHLAGDIAYLSSSISAGIEEIPNQPKGTDISSTLMLSENADNVYTEPN